MENPEVYLGLGGSLIVVGLVEGIKRMAALDDSVWMRIVPAIALALGIVWNALIKQLMTDSTMSWWLVLFLGVFTGLSAAGLFSGQKTTRGI